MVVTAYLFLVAISSVSGTYFPVNQNASPSKIQPNRSYQRPYQFPYRKVHVSQFLLDDCLRRYLYVQIFKCYPYFRSMKEDLNPKLKSNYINSILDEDKGNVNGFNASDKVLNSTWIEIRDARKMSTPLNSENTDEEEIHEYMSFLKKCVSNREEVNPSVAEEKGNETNGTATGGSNTEEEKTTEIQQQTFTINETGSGDIEEGISVTEETIDVPFSKKVTEGKTIAQQDLISTVKINEENKGNTHFQKKTTDVSSSETVEKSTIANQPTNNAKLGIKETRENATVRETYSEVTTEKETEEKSSSTEQNLSTESHSRLTPIELENLNNDTTLALLFTDNTKSESVSVSDADISPLNETETATSSSIVIFPSASVTESSVYTTERSDGGFTSTMITDSESTTGDYVTKSKPIIPEHIINIRSIKIAKIVLSVLLLVTGLIAVVMLAVYLFRVRRGAVQYDQLTLLP